MDYLKRSLRSRLALRQKDTAGNFKNYPQAVGGIWTREGKPDARWKDGTIFSDNLGGHSLRLVGRADKIVRLNHTGWYTDSFQDSSTFGLVFRLPNGRGFLAAYSDPWNCDKDGEGPHSLEPESYPTEEEAARRADRLAERYAEFCREYDAKQCAESRITQIREEELPAVREEIRELCDGIRQSTLAPSVCAELKRSIRRLLKQKAELFDKVRELEADYWKAVQF
jgi:hypothetical protein